VKSNTVYDANVAVSGNVNGTPFNFDGGRLVLGTFGTFGAGTIKLQFTTDADSTWIDVGTQNAVATQLTAAGTTTFYLPPGRYRVVLTGSTTPTLQYFVGSAETGT
jgi:hypothetical protein